MYEITAETVMYKTQQQWLDQRQNTIGGSDIPIIMEVSAYATPYDLIVNKTKGYTPTENPIFEFGHIMEETIFRILKKKYKKLVSYDNLIQFKSSENPLFRASLDAFDPETDKVIEIKFANLYGSKKWVNKKGMYEIPDDYKQQLNWYLGILGKKQGIIAVMLQSFVSRAIPVVELEYEFDESLFITQKIKAVQFIEDLKNFNDKLPETVNTEQAITEDLWELTNLDNTIKSTKIKKDNLISSLAIKYGTDIVLKNKLKKIIIKKTKTGKLTTTERK